VHARRYGLRLRAQLARLHEPHAGKKKRLHFIAMPFLMLKMHHFTKTGSGQTWENKLRGKSGVFLQTEKYASNICGERAVASLHAHDPSTPYFLYLPWQAVHHPHEAPPDWPEQKSDIDSYRGMLWGTDRYVGKKKRSILFAMPFYTKNDHFTKTGSGQT
jgi:hypothetical protein